MEIPGITAVFFEVLAEVEDKVVNGTGGWVYVVAPYNLQDLFPGYNFTFILDQKLQEHGFFFAQLIVFTIFANALLSGKIDLVITKTIDVRDAILVLDLLVL